MRVCHGSEEPYCAYGVRGTKLHDVIS